MACAFSINLFSNIDDQLEISCDRDILKTGLKKWSAVVKTRFASNAEQ